MLGTSLGSQHLVLFIDETYLKAETGKGQVVQARAAVSYGVLQRTGAILEEACWDYISLDLSGIQNITNEIHNTKKDYSLML